MAGLSCGCYLVLSVAAWGQDSPEKKKSTTKITDRETKLFLAAKLGHPQGVSALLITPDSKQVISRGPDKSVRLWSIEDGKEVRRLTELEDPPLSHISTWGLPLAIVFSPDGKRALTGHHKGIVRLWDLAGWKQLAQFKESNEDISCVAFSPDGRQVYCGTRDAILTFEIGTGKKLLHIKTNEGCYGIALSPDGKQLLTAQAVSGGGKIYQWDVETATRLRS
jgi:WD40 repeat protein